MKIVLSGVETNNKGAELMLYAILQEIENKHPEAEVFIPYSHIKRDISNVRTSLNFRYVPGSQWVFNAKKVFRHLHMHDSFLPDEYYVKGADFFLDGSGFAYSDQWHLSDETINKWNSTLKLFSKQGTKIVYLSQAFGPVEQDNTRKMLRIISDYASLIIPREIISYKYLMQSDVDMSKVKVFGDFTSSVVGVYPDQYKHLKNGICIIPNMRMIDKGIISYDAYLNLLRRIIVKSNNYQHPIYILNHEGKDDELFAKKCANSVGNGIEVVSGLNALEIKGIISSAYLVVTSRFHGLASALNSCVPSLATSWSHKYKELMRDYHQVDCIMPLDEIDKAVDMVVTLLNPSNNKQVRYILAEQLPRIKGNTMEMWRSVWDL